MVARVPRHGIKDEISVADMPTPVYLHARRDDRLRETRNNKVPGMHNTFGTRNGNFRAPRGKLTGNKLRRYHPGGIGIGMRDFRATPPPLAAHAFIAI